LRTLQRYGFYVEFLQLGENNSAVKRARDPVTAGIAHSPAQFSIT
jgi:hypothetical protein